MSNGSHRRPRRVLAIDDDPISLAIAAVLLESEGCVVLQASSGEEALKLLASERVPPDCILADLRMPSLAGTDLAGLLRESAPQALLLAMSASPPAEVQGYQGVLRKPLTPEALQGVFAEYRVRAPQEFSEEEGSSDLNGTIFERLQSAMSAVALEEVITAFLADTGNRIAAMRTASPEDLRRQAHTIRGGAAMVGAAQVSRLAAIIEAGINDAGDRLRQLDELEAYLRRAERILKQRLQA